MTFASNSWLSPSPEGNTRVGARVVSRLRSQVTANTCAPHVELSASGVSRAPALTALDRLHLVHSQRLRGLLPTGLGLAALIVVRKPNAVTAALEQDGAVTIFHVIDQFQIGALTT